MSRRRAGPSEGRTVIQVLADGVKGLFRALERVEEGSDPLEAFVGEAKKVLGKKSVRKLRGRPPKAKKPRKKLPREPETIDAEGHETH